MFVLKYSICWWAYLFLSMGSTPTVGSSRIKSSGLCRRDTANDTLRCCPPLKWKWIFITNIDVVHYVYINIIDSILTLKIKLIFVYLNLSIRVFLSGSSSRFDKKRIWSLTSDDFIPYTLPKYWNVSWIENTVNSASSWKNTKTNHK